MPCPPHALAVPAGAQAVPASCHGGILHGQQPAAAVLKTAAAAALVAAHTRADAAAHTQADAAARRRRWAARRWAAEPPRDRPTARCEKGPQSRIENCLRLAGRNAGEKKQKNEIFDFFFVSISISESNSYKFISSLFY